MRRNKSHLSKRYRLLGSLASLIILAVLILELTNTTHIFHKQKIPPIVPAHTNTGQPISNSQTPSAPSSPTTNSSSVNSPPRAAVDNHTLVTPYGNFVSNHFPGQNGSSTSEVSVCNTSPGATCYIKFTNASGETTQLASQTTNAQGGTSWYWDINKDAHLLSGQWQVTAVATLGSQVKSTDDSLKLTIQ